MNRSSQIRYTGLSLIAIQILSQLKMKTKSPREYVKLSVGQLSYMKRTQKKVAKYSNLYLPDTNHPTHIDVSYLFLLFCVNNMFSDNSLKICI